MITQSNCILSPNGPDLFVSHCKHFYYNTIETHSKQKQLFTPLFTSGVSQCLVQCFSTLKEHLIEIIGQSSSSAEAWRGGIHLNQVCLSRKHLKHAGQCSLRNRVEKHRSSVLGSIMPKLKAVFGGCEAERNVTLPTIHCCFYSGVSSILAPLAVLPGPRTVVTVE